MADIDFTANEGLRPPLLVAAMRLEIDPLLKLMDGYGVAGGEDPARVFFADIGGGRCIIGETGVGLRSAYISTRRMIERFNPSAVINFGLAGGVNPQFRHGDLVALRSVKRETRPDRRVETSIELTESFARLAWPKTRVKLSPVGVTCNRLVYQPEKAALIAREPECGIVDMESYAVIRAAAGYDLPCAVVRAVSDPLPDPLPSVRMLSAYFRSPSAGARLRLASGQPRQAWLLLRMLFFSRLAAKRNAAALAQWLSQRGFHEKPRNGCRDG